MPISRLATLSLLACCSAAACGSSGGGLPANRDMATGDMAMTTPDGAPQPDLASNEVTHAEGSEYKFVASAIILPKVRTEYALDLNGDGKTDNQLGNIIGALASQNLDPQASIEQAIASGNSIELIAIQSTDPTLKMADNAGVKISRAKVAPNPDFSGTGTFAIDTTYATAQLFGKIVSGKLSTNDPVTTMIPAQVTLALPLFPGGGLVPMRLNGAHVQVQSGGCPPNPTTGKVPLLCGQLHGSVKNDDVQKDIIPAMAASFTAQIMKDPNSSSSQQLRQIFDVGNGNGGNCTSSIDGTGKPGDGVISVCEVAGNSIIGSILAPDIDVFADDGVTYAPSKLNTSKDSLSVGVAFELVGAKF